MTDFGDRVRGLCNASVPTGFVNGVSWKKPGGNHLVAAVTKCNHGSCLDALNWKFMSFDVREVTLTSLIERYRVAVRVSGVLGFRSVWSCNLM